MKRKKLLKDAESVAHFASDKVSHAIDEAATHLGPLVEQASDAARPYVEKAQRAAQPYLDQAAPYVDQAFKTGARVADQAVRAAQPYVDQAVRTAQPYVDQAFRNAQPMVDQAVKTGAHYLDAAGKVLIPLAQDLFVKGATWAAHQLDAWQPRINEALERVSPAVENTVNRVSPAVEDALARIVPAVEAARGRVQDDLIPRFSSALHAAAEHPVTRETQRRLSLATQALAGELEVVPEPEIVPVKRKGGFFATTGKIVAAGAVLAGVVVAVKKLLGPSDTGWEAHQSSAAYVADPVADVVSDLSEPPAPSPAPQPEPEAPAPDHQWGEGSYVGDEPPAGYDVKGNTRSMKFHTPGSTSYERTIPDVWFATPEAAEAAGFTRAQH